MSNSVRSQARIPNLVCAVVGEVLGGHYYNHARLELLFQEAGAPGAPPEGNCVEKCERWLKRVNSDPTVDAYDVLGRVLEHFMDYDVEPSDYNAPDWLHGRQRVQKALARLGLSYQFGGRILGPGTSGATRSLRDILEQRDLGAIEAEFQRALVSVETDPAAALTAACAIVEALCKHYIDQRGLTTPKDQSIQPLWKMVQQDLGLDPKVVEEEDLSRILGGLGSIVAGLGSIRTHAGSAHGRGPRRYRPAPRHARLAVNAAHTVVLFVLDTWDVRREGAHGGG